jgi:hypothetical protein
MGSSALEKHGGTPMYTPSLERLHSLWQETSDFSLSADDLKGREFQLYFSGTVLNILNVMAELESSVESLSSEEFVERFQQVRPRMMRQLRLLSELGLALWPIESPSKGEPQ